MEWKGLRHKNIVFLFTTLAIAVSLLQSQGLAALLGHLNAWGYPGAFASLIALASKAL